MRNQNTTYNGWTNYETWLVNLWLTNDQDTDQEAREVAAFGADALSDWVEELVLESVPPSSLASDLLSAALGWVEWYEIAESLIEE